MKSILKKLLMLSSVSLLTVSLFAQDVNPVITAVPSLMIAPDARGGGMGDAGVATAPDIYSQHWNPAKYAFSQSQAGFGLSYTPWLRKITNDIAQVYGVGYYKIGNQNNQAISASVRYFSVGDVDFVRNPNDISNGVNSGGFFGSVSPYELALDVSYSRKLTSTFSGAVTFRYIRADYSGADDEGSAGSTFAADIAGYNESYVTTGNAESLLSFGFNISNIGGKISNNNGATSSFIPANLRIGGSFMYPIDKDNTLSLSLDLNKLLVPTPPTPEDGDYNGVQYQKDLQEYYDMGSVKGIFKSFGDAPGGFSEELKEIAVSTGLEFDHKKQFKLRTGYFHENKMKGNRRYFSFGAGMSLSAFNLDVAYLMSTANASPLDQTLRFSLGFDIEGIQQLFKK